MSSRPLRHAFADARGTTTIEYLVLLVCVLGVAYGGWAMFGKRIVQAIAGS